MDAAEFTVGEAAAMTGLSTHTIRAWERRHGALEPPRTAARQRRYSREDVEFLLRVKHLNRAGGRSIKVAIQEARGNLPLDLPAVPPSGPPLAPPAPGIWRSVADLFPSLIAVIDSGGRIVDSNIAIVRVTGRLRSEVQGMRFIDLIDPHDRAKAARIYRRPLRPHPGWELNVRAPGLKGLFSFDCRPIRDGDRWLIACVGRDLENAGLEIWPRVAESV
jgi:PAS domain S-box-containing protein